MDKIKNITQIIKDEHRKHKHLNWQKIAAIKILRTLKETMTKKMEKELTLQEVKANKFQLSMHIKKLIEDFEKNNQVKISNINVEQPKTLIDEDIFVYIDLEI